jgi:osmotically-inducible protein OsmY
MSISCRKRNRVICACAIPLVCGFGGLASRVDAQNVASRPTRAASVSQGAESSADEQLLKRVKAALDADPYFSDKHIDVSVEMGSVELHGFVFSAWELEHANRIARKAAAGGPVIDNLSIKLGG